MTSSVLACLLLIPIGALGQTIQMTSVSGAPGENIVVRLSLDAPPDKSPAALQWEFIFPAQLLELGQPAVELGPAAQSSGKSLTCTDRNGYTRICILAGGQKTIVNGTIATVHLKIRATAKAGVTTVKVDKSQGVTLDLKPLSIKDAESTITIR